MPVLELPGLMTWPEPGDISVTTTSPQFLQAGDYCATRVVIPRTGTIVGLKFVTGGVTTGCTLRFGFETDDGAIPARPSGTYAGGNTAYGDVAIADTDDNVLKTVTLGTPLAVTKGDLLWVTGRIQSGTPNALVVRASASVDSMLDPYLVKVQGGALTLANNSGQDMVLTYSGVTDDVFVNRLFASITNNLSPNAAGTHHESGAKIILPTGLSMRSDGFLFRMLNITLNTVGEVRLYDASDNVLASYAVPSPTVMIGVGGQFRGLWATPVDLPGGSVLRLVWKHTGASQWTNGLQYRILTSGTTSPPWLANHYITHRGPGGGAWTDQPTWAALPHVLTIDRLYLPDTSHQF